jgi:hypothetical protein
MESSKPPPTPTTPAEQETLETARGHLRDALGSVRNLAQLLHSVRVGPRAIAAVLPAVHGPCELIEGSVRTLLDVVAKRLPDRSATDELTAYVAPRAQELSRELALALDKPMNARLRLRLEEAITRLSRELDAARALVDLLDDSVRGSAVRLNLDEIVREAAKSPDPGNAAASITLSVEPNLRGEVLVIPRVAIALLGVGARLVAQSGELEPHLGALAPSLALQTLEIRAAPAQGETVSFSAPPVIAPTLACATSAARVLGATLTWDIEAKRFSLELPA